MPLPLIFLIVIGANFIILALWYENKHSKEHKDGDENEFKKPFMHP